jgi:peptidoglycan/LPS O-acetylase OafA/YrhL
MIFSLLSQGWAGVPVFFVISGYCIAAACESAMAKNLSTKTYFFRRFRRIYPPFWILLILVVVAHYSFVVFSGTDYFGNNAVRVTMPWAMSASQWMGTMTLTEGWRDHLFGERSRFFMTHAWSLGYEEQFYFVCGMAMLFGRKGFYRCLAFLSAAVFVVAFVNFAVVALPVDGFFFDGRWLMFAAGVLVFHVLQFGNELSRKRAIYLLAFGLYMAAAWVVAENSMMAKHAMVSFAFAAVLIFLFKYDRQIAESRILRPITLCGVMCYSLYLTHDPLELVTTKLLYQLGVNGEWSTLFITIPVCVLVSVLFAWGFHVLVERRFLNTPPTLPTKPKPVPQEEVPEPVNA